MTRALAIAALVCSACFPFGDALNGCEAAGRCPDVDGGVAGGGGGGGGGGTNAGGGTGTGGGDVFIPGLGYVQPLCTADGICWQHPLPAGSTVRAVWVFNENDWWLAGARGALFHFDGAGLKVDTPPSESETADWWGLWGTSTGDLLATGMGNNGLYRHHHDDGGWESVNVGTFDSPVITGNEDAGVVWVVGQYSVARGSPSGSFTTAQLMTMTPGRPWGAAGATADSCYVTLDDSNNDPPFLYAFTGGLSAPNFRGITVPTTNTLSSVMQHSNGSLWVVGNAPDSETTQAFAAQQQDDGGWLELQLNAGSNTGLGIAQISDSDDVLVLTGEGKIYRASPGTPGVQPERQPVDDFDTALTALHSAGGIAVGAGVGVITVRDATGQWTTPVPADYRDLYTAVWKDGVMAVLGYGTLVTVRDAGSWPLVMPPDPQGVFGIGVLDGALVLSEATDVYRSDGVGGWLSFGCHPPVNDNFGALAVAGDDVWITTIDGGIFHTAVDAGCAPETFTPDQLVAIAAASPDRVWAVGPGGAAWSRSGGTWTRSPAAGMADLNDVVMSGTDTYAIGADGHVYRLGTSAAPLTTGCSRAIEVVTTDAGDRIYAAGNASGGPPQLCIVNPGGQARTLQVPSDQNINALRSDGRTLYLFGASFTVLTYPLP